MPWVLLIVAISFEVVGTTLLKLSEGFSKPWLGAASIGAYFLSYVFFAPTLKTIPVGVAYAIWAGTGIVLITVVGYFYFEQKLQALQYLFIVLILVGAIGLNITTTTNQ